MTFVSYARNCEDVLLWRALRDVNAGLYLDVGAGDPTLHSVTQAFYLCGWRGINIEPVLSDFERLRGKRPNDINLQIVAGARRGTGTIHEVMNTGPSTSYQDLAERDAQTGHAVVARTVEVRTLNDICAEFAHGTIHFARIAVEGSERDVLTGFDLRMWRPWIIVIEAALPTSQEENHLGWEDILLSADYNFAHADGLNRFYVAKERSEQLLPAFKYPPNVFDDFVISETREATLRAHHAGQQADRAEQRAQVAEQMVERAEGRILLLQQQIEHLRQRLDKETVRSAELDSRLVKREALLVATFRSHSWRLTAPLRALRKHVLPRVRLSAPAAEHWDAGPARPTIFIECTHTYHSDLNTGIQRVVRNVIRNAEAVVSELGYAVVPVRLEAGSLIAADVDVVLANKQALPETGTAASTRNAATRRAWLTPRYAIRRPIQLAWRGLLRLVPAARVLAPARRRAPAVPADANLRLNLDYRQSCQSDILLLLDSSWGDPPWPAVQRFKDRGGRVAGVIFDIIPISHSYTCVPELTLAFTAWLHRHVQYSDAFIGISQSVARQLEHYFETAGNGDQPLTRAPVAYFHLGSELDFVVNAGEPRPILAEIFDNETHVFLMVGSLEPRKNHAFVLDAFETLWAAGVSASLVVIGRHGWKTEDFVDRVARHKLFGRQLFLLRDASDSDLDYAYRNASALVIASEIEGFGLPVVEAFQRGLPVLCSDIPVFREIAEGKAVFFGIEHPDQLADVLLEYSRSHDPRHKRDRTPQSWLSWRESTTQLFTALLQALDRVPDASRHPPRTSATAAIGWRSDTEYIVHGADQ